jgi:hypothetical protein
MKAATYIEKIEREQTCSIDTAEKLTRAAHREGLLESEKAIRFRPLYADFDIVNSDLFVTGEFNKDVCEKVGTIENLKSRLFRVA